mmetsp:Transcript_9222/g.16212  ORF Transcript_9222/g.16212 Transcript_9222/m.16212 type:complete len:265 (+) Transcript_9222:267-1061(+)
MGLTNNDQGVERRTKVNIEKLLHSSSHNTLSGLANTSHTNAASLAGKNTSLANLFFNVEELLQSLTHSHVTRRVIDKLSGGLELLNVGLLNLDVKQAERVELGLGIDLNLVVETVRLPVALEKRDRYSLAKVVQLKTTASNGVHNGCVVDDLHLDALLHSTQVHVCVCGCSKGVTNHKQSHIDLFSAFQNLIRSSLNKFAICQANGFSVESLEFLGVHAQNRCVMLQEDTLAALYSLKALHSDVSLIAETKSNDVQHPHRRPFA